MNRNYLKKDLLEIAKGQFELQEIAKKENKNNLFFDTDLLTIKIWSDYKYGDCDKWILDRILSNKEFMYVLCSPTVVWELDPLRENPKDRDKLYKIYLENLQKLNLNFIEVSGELPDRVKLFLTRN